MTDTHDNGREERDNEGEQTMTNEIAHAYETTIEAMSRENARLLGVLKDILHTANKEDTIATTVIKNTIAREVNFGGAPAGPEAVAE